MWIPILTDLTLGIHQSKNCCVTHGWFVCAVHQLSSTGIILELSVCRASVPVPGNVPVGSFGLCHFSAGHGRVECALGTAFGLKTIWGLGGSPSAMASWLPRKSVSGHL